MKPKWIIPAAVLLLGLPLAATSCGEEGNELPLASIADQASRIACAKMYTCCTAAELVDIEATGGFVGEDGCVVSAVSTWTEYVVNPMTDALETGRGKYDAGKAYKCLEAFESLGCVGTNNPADFFANCDLPWVGLQAAGEQCQNHLECLENHACVGTPEVCTKILGDGEACQVDGTPCEATLYCNGQQCVPRKAETQVCADKGQCQLGLDCINKVCTKPAPKCIGSG